MKRHNLISLISIIFLLLVGMVMTGCATALHDAAKRGDINTLTQLLNSGKYDVNAKETARYSETPLHFAIQNGHIDIVKLLIDRGEPGRARAALGARPP